MPLTYLFPEHGICHIYGIDIQMHEVLSSSKCYPDGCHLMLAGQGMVLSYQYDNDVCVNSAYQAVGASLVQRIFQVNNASCIGLFVVTSWHGLV